MPAAKKVKPERLARLLGEVELFNEVLRSKDETLCARGLQIAEQAEAMRIKENLFLYLQAQLQEAQAAAELRRQDAEERATELVEVQKQCQHLKDLLRQNIAKSLESWQQLEDQKEWQQREFKTSLAMCQVEMQQLRKQHLLERADDRETQKLLQTQLSEAKQEALRSHEEVKTLTAEIQELRAESKRSADLTGKLEELLKLVPAGSLEAQHVRREWAVPKTHEALDLADLLHRKLQSFVEVKTQSVEKLDSELQAALQQLAVERDEQSRSEEALRMANDVLDGLHGLAEDVSKKLQAALLAKQVSTSEVLPEAETLHREVLSLQTDPKRRFAVVEQEDAGECLFLALARAEGISCEKGQPKDALSRIACSVRASLRSYILEHPERFKECHQMLIDFAKWDQGDYENRSYKAFLKWCGRDQPTLQRYCAFMECYRAVDCGADICTNQGGNLELLAYFWSHPRASICVYQRQGQNVVLKNDQFHRDDASHRVCLLHDGKHYDTLIEL